MSSTTVNKLFTEIFRPKKIENVVLIPRIYNEIKSGLTQNYLFYGPAGTGKCLDYNEEIEIFVNEKTYNELFK